jgi:glycosyltransferase involved in cell wall biosynthesis
MENPLISVVICTCDGELYLREQLQSIVCQTYQNIEIIVSDDNSFDETISIINEFAKSDKRIKLFKNIERLGYNKNYEKALKLVTGNFVAISDQDDIWRHDKIEILLNKIVETNCILVYAHSQDFENGATLPVITRYNGRLKYFEGTDFRKLLLRNTISGHSVLFNKELLHYALPFKGAIFYDFWLALVACVNGGISFCGETLVFRRKHSANASLTFITKELKRENPYAFLKDMLEEVKTIDHLPVCKKKYLKNLTQALSYTRLGKVNWKLFWFCIHNRKIIFYYKPQRFLSFFSFAKNSYLIAKGALFR